jgi:hypothetical protein
MLYELPYTPKALHELFCYSQSYLSNNDQGNYFRLVMQDLIESMEVHRPLKPNGKHENLHTPTCGCEDK